MEWKNLDSAFLSVEVPYEGLSITGLKFAMGDTSGHVARDLLQIMLETEADLSEFVFCSPWKHQKSEGLYGE